MSGSPAGRVLTLLERVQEHPGLTAPRLAEELGVSERTVRRYVTTLHDLGIPVEAGRGKFGGHRLRPGFRMPPLMLTTDEAVAVTLALAVMRGTDVRPRRLGRDRPVQARPGTAAERFRPGGRRARRGQSVFRRVAGGRDTDPGRARHVGDRRRPAPALPDQAPLVERRRHRPRDQPVRHRGAAWLVVRARLVPSPERPPDVPHRPDRPRRPAGGGLPDARPTSTSWRRWSGPSHCPGRSAPFRCCLRADRGGGAVDPALPRRLRGGRSRPDAGAIVDQQPGLLRAADQ